MTVFSQASAAAETELLVLPRWNAETITIHMSLNSSGQLWAWPALFPNDWFSFAREVVNALVRERLSLGYQLSHAQGAMTEEELAGVLDEFLMEPRNVPDLPSKALMLAELIPELIDAELVSAIFHTEITDAEEALTAAAKQLRFDFASIAPSLPAESAR